jgi:hypothetical protein
MKHQQTYIHWPVTVIMPGLFVLVFKTINLVLEGWQQRILCDAQKMAVKDRF